VGAANDQSGANNGCTACTGAACTGTPGGTAGQAQNTFTGDVTIVNAADIAWMKNVVNITGYLHIDNTGLTGLNGLGTLQTVGKEVSIYNNAALSNLGGLTGLKTVGSDMNIQSNAVLTNVNGLSALTTVTGYLQFYSNNSLSNLGGLTALTSVGNYFNIQSNPALANVDGLVNLASVGAAPGAQGYLQLYSNTGLTSILNLIKPTGKLATLGGYLSIQYNSSLSICQSDALKTALTASGWAKAYNQGSNLACGTPKTCTGAMNATCQ
jgi:hypothetical protein